MRATRTLLTLIAMMSPALAQAARLADVEIYDRTADRVLPIHEHDGRLYVAGEPRHRYELRVRNASGSRVLVVTSVDGVNVVNGKTAAQNQSGYVIEPWDSIHIEGWRKSLDEVAAFYFTRLRDSYAARTGRPEHVGVIGVALFREREYCCVPLSKERAADSPHGSSASAQQAEASRDSVQAGPRRDSQLGTGHAERTASPAQYVDFRRASSRPDETIVIYYDSRRNLVAQGVLPQHRPMAQRRPDPFPDGFVPDP